MATTAFMEYQERLLATATAVATLGGDLDEMHTQLSDRTGGGENESLGTHRTASMSEIMAHHESDSSDLRPSDNYKENSFVMLNTSSVTLTKGHAEGNEEEASLRSYEQTLKSELKRLNDQIYQVHLERETLELEKEITVEEAKAKLAKLKAEAERQTERLKKADAHLEKARQKQRDIEHLKAAQVTEIEKLVEISEGLVKESRVIEMKTREVEVTVYEYGKRLGMDDRELNANRESKASSSDRVAGSHNEHEALPPLGGGIQFAERKGLMKIIRATTRKVIPKKKSLFGSRTQSGPKFGTIEFQKQEAEKEHEYLLMQLEQASEELHRLDSEQYAEEQSELDHATFSLAEEDSNVSG